jgi:hypothetical protein
VTEQVPAAVQSRIGQLYVYNRLFTIGSPSGGGRTVGKKHVVKDRRRMLKMKLWRLIAKFRRLPSVKRLSEFVEFQQQFDQPSVRVNDIVSLTHNDQAHSRHSRLFINK